MRVSRLNLCNSCVRDFRKKDASINRHLNLLCGILFLFRRLRFEHVPWINANSRRVILKSCGSLTSESLCWSILVMSWIKMMYARCFLIERFIHSYFVWHVKWIHFTFFFWMDSCVFLRFLGRIEIRRCSLHSTSHSINLFRRQKSSRRHRISY